MSSPANPSKKIFVIIDANAVIHRSYHALPPLTSPRGEVVNAVYGFTSLLLKVLRELKPDYIAAAFDLAGPTFRHEAYAAYKATRVKAPDELYAQIPLVKKLLEAFHIPVFEKQGYEADDVIGTIVKKLGSKKNITGMIVTGDMDTLQLVGEQARVYTLKSGLKEAFIYGLDEVKARFGLDPVQLPDFKGLKGDPSDNIPGVPGIGDKTASALLQKFGTLEKLYEALEGIASGVIPAQAGNQISPRRGRVKNLDSGSEAGMTKGFEKPLTEKLVKLLLEYRDQAFFSKELATINCETPIAFSLESAGRGQYEREKVVAMFRELGFLSLVERLAHIEDASQADDSAKPSRAIPTSSAPRRAPAEPITEKFLKQLISQKSKALRVHLEVETLLGSTLPRFLVIGADQRIGIGNIKELLADRAALALLKKILADLLLPKHCHGAKALMHLLSTQGLGELCGVAFDTEIAYLLTRSNARDTALPTVILQELGEEYRPAPDSALAATQIAEYLERLVKVLGEKIERQGLHKVFYEIEMPLVPILARMEDRGIAIDRKRIEKIASRFEKELLRLESDIHKLAGATFNINSTKELREMLFVKMQIGIKGLRRTPTGVTSTQASELEKLKGAHPIIEKILSYREFFKIKTTYLDTLPTLVKDDGRIHTTFMQLGAATGRISSQEPNLQNIPIRGEWGKEIRSVFVSQIGWTLLAADYSQIELRVVAHLSKDPVMRDAFLRGEDIHTRTASVVFGVSPDKVTKDMRMQAKTLNFGVLYGMGPQAFAEGAGVSLEKAKAFIADYFREFAGVKGFMDATKAEAEARGYVETLFGRRRYIPEIRSINIMVKRAGERMAINMPVQGTATADIIKMAMIRIDARLKKEELANDIQLLLQVHDELVFEVRDGDGILKKAATLIKEEMEGVTKLDVPLVAECKAGRSWGEMKMTTP